MLRVTSGMLAESTLRNLNVNTARLEALQGQLTSGKRLRKPSDDPVAVAAALGFRTDVDKTNQFLKNIDAAASWLGTTDTSLDSLGKILQRAHELAVAGANGSLSSDAHQAIAVEVQQLIEQAVQIGNSNYGDQYIFAGNRTTVPPFTLSTTPATTVTYSGDNGALVREIGVNATIGVNLLGNTTFDPAFKALIRLEEALGSSDTAALSQIHIGPQSEILEGNPLVTSGGVNTGITLGAVNISQATPDTSYTFSSAAAGQLTLTATVGGIVQTQTVSLVDMPDAAASPQTLNFNNLGITITLTGSGASGTAANIIDSLTKPATNELDTESAIIGLIVDAGNSVLSDRAKVGAKVNRLDLAGARLEDMKLNISEMLSKQEDLDMTEAITRFTVAENVYKAALAAGARSIQPSLLDFLR